VGVSRRRGPAGDPIDGRGGTRFAVGFFVAIFLLLGGLYAAGYALTSDRVPRQVSVAGVDIGGLRPGQARARLRGQLAPRAYRFVVARQGDRIFRVDPLRSGLRLDVAGTVRAAGGGRSLDPLRMVQVLVGGDDIDPVVAVDQQALDAAVDDLAAQVGSAPVEGAVHFGYGRVVPVYPTPGWTLDEQATKKALQKAFLADAAPSLELPVERLPTHVTATDVDDAVERFAERAMSAPVVVHVGRRSARLSPERIGAALSMVSRRGRLVPVFDRDELARQVAAPLDPLTKDPRPATVVLQRGRPRAVPGVPGTQAPPGVLANRLLGVLRKSGSARSVAVQLRPLAPTYGVDDARRLGVREMVSRFTTYFPHSRYRNTNIGRAAALIDGVVLKPGHVFDLNRVVGRRTVRNGFMKGSVIDDGMRVQDYGGGLSQVATTVYNAAFFAGMEDVEHHPHRVYFNRYPMGRETAVAWGSLDLRFLNSTPYGVLVRAWVRPSTPSRFGEMHVQMWSTRYWKVRAGLSGRYAFTRPGVRYDRTGRCVAQAGAKGFQVDVFRYLYRDGRRVRTEKDHVRYDPADTVRCRQTRRPR
jgi:vancomycin resistance protein YoaR